MFVPDGRRDKGNKRLGMKKKKAERFQFNIIKISAILVIAVASSLLAVFYYGTSRIVLEMSDQVTDEISRNVTQLTDNFLLQPADYTSMVSGFATDLLGDDYGAIPNHEELWKDLWQFLIKTPSLQSIFIADPQGSYVQVRREPRLATRIIDRSGAEPLETWLYRDAEYNIVGSKTKVPTFDPRTRPWYKATRPEPRNYWTSVYVFTTAQTPGISVTWPITNKQGELAGVVSANTPLHALSDFVSRQRVSDNGLVFIVNRDEELIAYPDVSKTTVRDEASGKLRLGRIDDLDSEWVKQAYRVHADGGDPRNTYEVDGQRYISTVFPLEGDYGNDWHIVVAIPERDLLGSVGQLFWVSLLVGLLISLVSLGGIYVIARVISHQIEQLTAQMGYIDTFELEKIRGVNSHIREIQTMNDSLMKSVTTIRSFAKYVPAQLVRQLLEKGEEIRIGGKEAKLTLMFSDIEGFTGIAEQLGSDQVMVHLSDYFDHLSGIVRSQKGTVDKYIGDSLMAFWGQPLPLENGPYLACRAALLCVADLAVVNQQWAAQGKPVMKTRFGIHTGMVTVGNVGSQDRLNYSAVGDNVNIASRLEGVNRDYGTRVVISSSTHEYVREQFLCRSLDRVQVKGRREPIRIYELIAEWGSDDGGAAQQPDTGLLRFYAGYERAYEAWEAGDTELAVELLDKVVALKPDDRPASLLRGRCREAK